MTRLNPAYTVLRKIRQHESGEPNYSAIAEELGVAKTTVIRWTLARKGRGVHPRGTGGVIPNEYRRDLVKISGGRVCLDDFLVKEVVR